MTREDASGMLWNVAGDVLTYVLLLAAFLLGLALLGIAGKW